MSGGQFDYKQSYLEDIANDIEELIEMNDRPDDWGYVRGYKKETIKKFQQTVDNLRETYEMVRRVDWLVSGDDGEETFHERWKDKIKA